MPQVLPLIAAIVGIGASGFGIGETLANQPSGKPPAAPLPTAAQISGQQQPEKAAIGQQAPNILSSTSGLVNPDYVAQISQLLAGTAGNTGSTGAARQVAQQLFGLPGLPGAGGGAQPSTPARTGATTPPPAGADTKLSDFLNQFMYA
jgi:hypothetical protein